jgi:anti-sigma B factor antagonist
MACGMPRSMARSRRTIAATRVPSPVPAIRAHTRIVRPASPIQANQDSQDSQDNQDSQQLQISFSMQSGYTLVNLSGELDLATVHATGYVLRTLLPVADSRLILDLSDLTFIDARGVYELESASRLAAAAGGWLRLAQVSDLMQRLLNLLQLTDRLPTYTSVAAAARGDAAAAS